jgi:hypothetical protein
MASQQCGAVRRLSVRCLPHNTRARGGLRDSANCPKRLAQKRHIIENRVILLRAGCLGKVFRGNWLRDFGPVEHVDKC